MPDTYEDRGLVKAKYEIGFYPDSIAMLESGKKWLTYRLTGSFDYLKPGDKVQLKEHGTHRLIGETTIVSLTSSTLGELPINASGHESYRDKQHQRDVLSGYAGGKLEDNEIFIVLEFEPLRRV